jgi:hypothetical protein
MKVIFFYKLELVISMKIKNTIKDKEYYEVIKAATIGEKKKIKKYFVNKI